MYTAIKQCFYVYSPVTLSTANYYKIWSQSGPHGGHMVTVSADWLTVGRLWVRSMDVF